MADLATLVRTALGDRYDAAADYVVVRPAMVGTPKYAGCSVVGEFAEDSRAASKMVVLLRPAAAKPKAPLTTSERVRSIIGRSRGK